MPNIETMWVEPLALFDAYLRLVANRDDTTMAMHANMPNAHPIAKGTARAYWLQRLNHQDDINDPAVSVVPFYEHQLLTWRVLKFSEFPRWSQQFVNQSYHPCGDNNTKHLLAMSRNHGNGRVAEQFTQQERQTAEVDRQTTFSRIFNLPALLSYRLQQREFTHMLKAHLHPTSAILPEGNIHADWPAGLFIIERQGTNTFLPMALFANGTTSGYPGHCTATYQSQLWRQARQKAEWRRVQSHGFHPTPSFYGKRWLASRSSATALYAGIELEMELNGRQERDTQAALFCAADEFGQADGAQAERLHIERDGSVHGLEAPLMPHEIGSYHGEMFWRKMWKTVCSVGASNNNRSCGMHIHVNADAALTPPPSLAAQLTSMGVQPRGHYYTETVGFLIDLMTNMLAGGQQQFAFAPYQSDYRPYTQAVSASALNPCWIPNVMRESNGNEPKPIAYAFGRPQTWRGDYAKSEFSLCRKTTSLGALDRYRAVNWINENTIEFRLFGPQEFDLSLSKDWLNVTTQFTAAIVQYARMHALRAVLKGAELRNHSFTDFYATIPEWLKPMLVANNYLVGINARNDNGAMIRQRRSDYESAGITFVGANDTNRFGYAIMKPGFEENSPLWLLGCLRPSGHSERNSVQGRYESQNVQTLTGGNEINANFAMARRTQLYLAGITLWEKLIAFMRSEAPVYNIALNYLDKIQTYLPTVEQRQGLAMWEQHLTPNTALDVTAQVSAVSPATEYPGPRPSAMTVTVNGIDAWHRASINWQTDVFDQEAQ